MTYISLLCKSLFDLFDVLNNSGMNVLIFPEGGLNANCKWLGFVVSVLDLIDHVLFLNFFYKSFFFLSINSSSS